MPDTALLIIDIQKDLAGDPATQIPAAQRIRDAGSAIIKKARATVQEHLQRGELSPLILIFVQHEETPDQGPLQRGTRPWELVFSPDESSSHERLIAKTTRNTFESNPDLAKDLKDIGVKHIVAFGIQSECCVLETAKGALTSGFDVTLLSGAQSTYNTTMRTAAEIEQDVEDQLGNLGAQIIDWSRF